MSTPCPEDRTPFVSAVCTFTFTLGADSQYQNSEKSFNSEGIMQREITKQGRTSTA